MAALAHLLVVHCPLAAHGRSRLSRRKEHILHHPPERHVAPGQRHFQLLQRASTLLARWGAGQDEAELGRCRLGSAPKVVPCLNALAITTRLFAEAIYWPSSSIKPVTLRPAFDFSSLLAFPSEVSRF
uniref:Uncharacterized protein n=1 Tax=Prymnesium polylepis TaxID=72548 RepID=A0A7S4MLI3_9EUKA